MFEHIFKGIPDTSYVSVMQITDGRRLFDYFTVTDFLHKVNDYIGQTDIYYAPAPRKSQGNELTDVLGTRVLWVDAQQEQPRPTFPASITVHSGGGWHLYWLLNTFISSNDRIAEMNVSVRDDLEGDNVQNANRFLRVPGTFNGKQAVLRPVELRTFRPTLVYDAEDFGVLSKLDGKTKHKIRTGDTRGYGGDRSRRDWAIIVELVRAGASDELIGRLFSYQPCGDKFRDPNTNGDEYLTHTIARVREKPSSRVLQSNIVETPRGYLAIGAKGDKVLSTFIIKPKMLLMGEKGKSDAIVGDIVTPEYIWENITFPREAFNDRKSFDKYLTVSAWSWFGKDDDIRALLPYLLDLLKREGLPKTRATTVLGRHGDAFVGPTQTIYNGDIYVGTDAPIVFMDTGKTKIPVEYAEGPCNLTSLTTINEPAVLWPVLGWFMCTPYKPVIESLGTRFPILNVYGTKGSGKTSIIRTFQRLMGYRQPVMMDCKTTRFVMLTLLGMTNAIPVALSEYRQEHGGDVTRFVLLSYDTSQDARGRGDQTVTTYALTAPFSVDGEDIMGDPAAKERIIAVPLHPDVIAEGTEQFSAFNCLQQEPLENFAASYVMFTLRQDVLGLIRLATQKVQEAFPMTLPTRIRSNMIVDTMGILSYCTYTKTGVPDLKEVLQGVLAAVWNETSGRGTALVDIFVERIVNAVAMNDHRFYFRYKEGVLWFQLSTAFEYWLKQRRASNQSSLDKDAIRLQLTERFMSRGIKGQYLIEPKIVGGVMCYGINLEAAVAAGLDIPNSLHLTDLTVHINR